MRNTVKFKLAMASALLAISFPAVADLQGSAREYNRKILFESDSQPTLELIAPKCLAALGEENDDVTFKGIDENLNKLSSLSLKVNGQTCAVERFSNFQPPVAMTMSAPVVVAMAPAPMQAISSADTMSREFVVDQSAFYTDIGSTRPSALILMKNVRQVTAHNKALCEGFVQLETIDQAIESTGVAVEDQVVTKMPLKDDYIDPASTDCNEILAKFNYQATNIVAANDKAMNLINTTSNGPFVVVFHPKTTKVQQVIDLNGYSTQEIKQFGQNWHTIFAQSAVPEKKSSWLTSLTTLVKKFFDIAVCGDPNLVYIFNPQLGDMSKNVCQAVSTLENFTASTK